MHSLAATYRAAGKLDLALPLCEETLKLQKAKLGHEHHSTLASMNKPGLDPPQTLQREGTARTTEDEPNDAETTGFCCASAHRSIPR